MQSKDTLTKEITMKKYAIAREYEPSIFIHVNAQSPEDAAQTLANLLFPQRKPIRINGKIGQNGLFCYIVNNNGIEKKIGMNYFIFERPNQVDAPGAPLRACGSF